MSQLRIETLSLMAADLGPENPLAALVNERELHEVAVAEGVPQDMLDNIAFGHLANILPYTLQDGYTRQRKKKDFTVAVLENEHLKATFLLDYGGRLWSLLHKPSGRDLVTVNPVFQPANLALRNAWFSGGVEWNIGTIGHTPFTCAPMFAAQVDGPNGMPILRLYEWERIRQVAYQLDFYLPDGSPVLFVHARIMNPHDHEVAMYWWSNIAVPESEDTRVMVPADRTYRFAYHKELKILPVPAFDGVDRTYSTASKRAVDYFFHLEDDDRRWIAALDKSGKGLVQTSTNLLKGRKLFLWGTGQGGCQWQDFLSKPGNPYLEIQAGLARTQLEHLKMPANATWDWLEAYGLLEANPDAIHGDDWSASRHETEVRLEQLISRQVMNRELARSREWQDQEPKRILHMGSGWGYLEQERRRANAERPFASKGLPFPQASREKQQDAWLHLLNAGSFPKNGFNEKLPAFMVQTEWCELLEKALLNDAENWAAQLHLGVMYAYAGKPEQAKEAWQASLRHKETPWAHRNLAVLAEQANLLDIAIDHLRQAFTLKPTLTVLAIELAQLLLKASKTRDCLALCETLDAKIREHGRIRFLEAQAALMEKQFAIVQAFFDDQIVIADLREGATQLTELWYDYHAEKLSQEEGVALDNALRERVASTFPIPKQFDFRMLES